MKKNDIILILTILIINTVFLLQVFPKGNSSYANVYSNNVLIMELDLSEDGVYSVDGVNGEVEITVKNGKVAITKETSPQNICSKQGYVNVDVIPLICLPNEIVVEGQDSEVDGVAR